ncbi:2-hydroxyacid dehydrogenase [Candidatus Gottesmanbacteria bacterium]|nr:2-hydroxyacid dehydrogenase [Candidatus Gottesmanbacteria bacterium]
MYTIHFDVDEEIAKYLKGIKYPHWLNEKNKSYQNVEAISISHLCKFGKSTFQYFPKLKLIITRSVGVDHIDLEECKRHSIAVYHILDYGAISIAEHALALLLSGTRRLFDANKKIKKGEFNFRNLLGYSLYNKTIGIIGTGRIGLEFIKLIKPFNCQIIAYDIYKNEKAAKDLDFSYVSLDELLQKSDIISLHIPLNNDTHHIIDNNKIQKMKNGVILINTSRGGLIHTKALIDHINKFYFIGLDVLEDEQSFNKNHPLLNYDNVLITPHIAFYTDETVKLIGKETMHSIERFTKNDKTGRVV